MKNKPLVTICCIAYNHEAYITECLEGFLMQKTDFPFEIVIHDDASTDGTADIIRKYEAKYPDIIKPIYQTENQYSKGKNIFDDLVCLARGKYIAPCEGDDFWNHPQKLQKMFDFMEEHPDFSCCDHNRFILDHIEKKYYPEVSYETNYAEERLEGIKKIFSLKVNYKLQSTFFRKDAYLSRRDAFLRDCLNAPMGDAQLLFHLFMAGKIMHFKVFGATYRRDTHSVSTYKDMKIHYTIARRCITYTQKMAYENGFSKLWDECEEGRKVQPEPVLTRWQHFLYRLRRIFNGYYFKFYIRPYYYRMKFKQYMNSTPQRRCRITISDMFL